MPLPPPNNKLGTPTTRGFDATRGPNEAKRQRLRANKWKSCDSGAPLLRMANKRRRSTGVAPMGGRIAAGRPRQLGGPLQPPASIARCARTKTTRPHVPPARSCSIETGQGPEDHRPETPREHVIVCRFVGRGGSGSPRKLTGIGSGRRGAELQRLAPAAPARRALLFRRRRPHPQQWPSCRWYSYRDARAARPRLRSGCHLRGEIFGPVTGLA